MDELRRLAGDPLSGPRRTWAARLGTFFFRHRTLVLPVLILSVVGLLRPRQAFGSPALDAALDAVGLALALAGQGLRVAVVGLAYIRRGGVDGHVHADHLVTGGLFAHCRNPLYVGNVMILIGLLIVFHNPWAYLFGIPLALLFYGCIVAAEEEFLRAKFGSHFEDYCRSVNRFWPDLRGLRETLRGFEFDWRRVIVKEYGSAFAWTGFAILLLAWEAVLFSPPHQSRPELEILGGVFLLLAAGWATARYLKKKRLLRQRHRLPPRDSVVGAA